MPQVDFYSISQPDEQDRLFFACRLTEKALGQGLKIYIHTDNEQVAQEMDDLLWSFRPESFIPHTIIGLDPEMEADDEVPVLIGYADKTSTRGQLLINLSKGMPPLQDSFERIAEIVPNREEAKASLREHWNTYKEKGFELDHHQL